MNLEWMHAPPAHERSDAKACSIWNKFDFEFRLWLMLVDGNYKSQWCFVLFTNIYLFSIYSYLLNGDSILHELLGYHTLVRSASPVSLSINCERENERRYLSIRYKLNEGHGHPLTPPMKGKLRNRPRIGTRLKKLTATGKKPLQIDKKTAHKRWANWKRLSFGEASTNLNSKKNP